VAAKDLVPANLELVYVDQLIGGRISGQQMLPRLQRTEPANSTFCNLYCPIFNLNNLEVMASEGLGLFLINSHFAHTLVIFFFFIPSDMMNDRNRRRGAGPSPVLLMLGYKMWEFISNLPVKPPVTLSFLALNIATHLYPDLISQAIPRTKTFWGWLGSGVSSVDPVRDTCMISSVISHELYYGGNYAIMIHRLFMSAIVHADDWHLYYNMTSFMYKGVNLEMTLGSSAFFGLMCFSWVGSSVLTYFFYSYSNPSVCVVGFSAVIFAVKYVWNHYSPGTSSILGMSIPTKAACWAELVLISILNPNASFLGHLAGILVGVVYVHFLSGRRRFDFSSSHNPRRFYPQAYDID